MHKIPLSESVLFAFNFDVMFYHPWDAISVLNMFAAAVCLMFMSIDPGGYE